MAYLPHTPADRQRMLERIGLSSLEELTEIIPSQLRLKRPLDLPPALSAYEVERYFEGLAQRNATFSQGHFLGAGAYRHYIPAVVDTICQRSEFLTAYTPYQPEASQGTLQAIFEFQSLICRLTGLEVANASVYDGGTAVVDGVLMACAQTRRPRVLVSKAVNPQTRQLLKTYAANGAFSLQELDYSPQTGQTLLDGRLDPQVAVVVLQIPNFLGIVEDGPDLVERIHEAGALALVAIPDLHTLGLLEGPGSYGADLACGEAQGAGNPLSFGGPYVGFLACTSKLMRRIPGRLVGLTEDSQGRRGYCLTLQTREQHIRRDKATSNICSNQALCALATTVYLSLLGAQGLRAAAKYAWQNTTYLRSLIAQLPGYTLPLSGPYCQELVVQVPAGQALNLNHFLACEGIQGGYPLGEDYPELSDCILFCCTELTRKAEIEELVTALRSFKEAY